MNLQWTVLKNLPRRTKYKTLHIQNKKDIIKFINYIFQSNITVGFSRKRYKCFDFIKLYGGG